MNKRLQLCFLLVLLVTAFAKTLVLEADVTNDSLDQGDLPSYSETGNANEFLDRFLENLGPFIEEKKLDPFALPDFEKRVQTWFFFTYGLKATNLKLQGLKSLHRAGNATLRYEEDIMQVQATLGLKNLHVTGTGRAWAGFINCNVWLDGSVDYVSATTHLEMPMTDSGKPKATMFKIVRLGKIELDITGLGPLNFILNYFGRSFVNSKLADVQNIMLGFINNHLDKIPIFEY